MRFPLDENLSPVIASIVTAQGHDTVHVRDRQLEAPPDQVVLAAAHDEFRVLISADTDFGEMLARTRAPRPSVPFLRRQQQRRAAPVAAIIIVNLPAIADDLEQGAVVVLDDTRIRIELTMGTRDRRRATLGRAGAGR